MRLETIQATCGECKYNFNAVRSTEACPNCGANFNEGVIETAFAQQETALANNKGHQFANKAGSGLKQTGSIVSGCGGVMIWLLVFLFVLAMCGGLA